MLPCQCLPKIPQVGWRSLYPNILERDKSGTSVYALCASHLTSDLLTYPVRLLTTLALALDLQRLILFKYCRNLEYSLTLLSFCACIF